MKTQETANDREIKLLKTRIKELEAREEEHKKVAETLKNSEERLKILFEYAPDGYYLYDLKGTFIDGNRAAEKIIGFKRDELIGKSFLKLKLLSPRDIAKAAKALAKNILGKGTAPEKYTLHQKNGAQREVEVSTVPVKIDGQTVVLGIARDISERKAFEERLRLIQVSIDQSNEGFFWIDAQGKFFQANDSAYHISGYTMAELERLSIYDIFPDFSGNDWPKQWRELKKKGYLLLQSTIYRKDGNTLEVELRLSFLEGIEQEFLVLVANDITQRKWMEDELRNMNQKLEQKVAEKTAELQLRVDELERYFDATMDREIKMKELRDRIEELEKKLGEGK